MFSTHRLPEMSPSAHDLPVVHAALLRGRCRGGGAALLPSERNKEPRDRRGFKPTIIISATTSCWLWRGTSPKKTDGCTRKCPLPPTDVTCSAIDHRDRRLLDALTHPQSLIADACDAGFVANALVTVAMAATNTHCSSSLRKIRTIPRRSSIDTNAGGIWNMATKCAAKTSRMFQRKTVRTLPAIQAKKYRARAEGDQRAEGKGVTCCLENPLL